MSSLEEEAQELRAQCQEALDLARRAVQELNRHVSLQQDELSLSCKRRAENALARAVQCYKQIESLARALPPHQRRRYKAEVKSLVSEVGITRKNLAAAVEQVNRAQLFGGAGQNRSEDGNPFSSSAIRRDGRSTVRDRIDESTQRLHETTRMLERTQQTVAETEEIGIGVLSDLGDQKQTLLETHERVIDVHKQTDRGGVVMREMSRKMMMNKACLIFIIVVLIIW